MDYNIDTNEQDADHDAFLERWESEADRDGSLGWWETQTLLNMLPIWRGAGSDLDMFLNGRFSEEDLDTFFIRLQDVAVRDMRMAGGNEDLLKQALRHYFQFGRIVNLPITELWVYLDTDVNSIFERAGFNGTAEKFKFAVDLAREAEREVIAEAKDLGR